MSRHKTSHDEKISHEQGRQMVRDQPERGRNHRLAAVVERNIRTLIELRRQMQAAKSRQDRLADAITHFTGSMAFVYAHVLWFGAWFVINAGWTPLPAFDPWPFQLLTMVVSLEAIFLATFVLISQNRAGETADKRADLDLQIDLLAEYEVTRVLMLVDAIADHLGLAEGRDAEVDELKADTKPDDMMREMERRERQITGAGGNRT